MMTFLLEFAFVFILSQSIFWGWKIACDRQVRIGNETIARIKKCSNQP